MGPLTRRRYRQAVRAEFDLRPRRGLWARLRGLVAEVDALERARLQEPARTRQPTRRN